METMSEQMKLVLHGYQTFRAKMSSFISLLHSADLRRFQVLFFFKWKYRSIKMVEVFDKSCIG